MKKTFKKLKFRMRCVWYALTCKSYIILSSDDEKKVVQLYAVNCDTKKSFSMCSVGMQCSMKRIMMESMDEVFKERSTTHQQMEEAVKVTNDIINGGKN